MNQTSIRILTLTLLLVLFGATEAFGQPIYDNIPNPLPGNLPSVGYEATRASEFGDRVQFSGTGRLLTTVVQTMSSFGCQSGHWNTADCATTPGATFSHPITLNIYNVGAGNAVGSLIASVTQTFAIPYRPSADNTNCTGANAGKWFNGTTCFNGFANTITFNLGGVIVPNQVIYGIAYNTSTAGYSPLGTATQCFASSGGCGYDSLNVATTSAPPSVGVNPAPSDAYFATSIASNYCDGGVGGVGTFRLDAGCWTGLKPAVRFIAFSPTAADATISGRIVANDGSAIAGATVNLAGTQTRKTITDASGSYRFASVETSGFYTLTPSRANYSFGPASRSFSQLGNTTEAAFTGTPNLVLAGNAIETPEYFVRQHYLDFLGREPDEAGFNFWSDQMLECGTDAECLERRKINVSAAYFLSIEFQQTGGLIDGLYKASYGVRPKFAEFMSDTHSIAENVVVGRNGWEQQLLLNKQAFVAAFVQRAEFQAAFDSLSNENYVDSLIAHTRVAFSESERAVFVSDLAGGRLTRAAVLLRIAGDDRFVSSKRNETFVMMQYFGYLRRDPDDSGYQFWLDKLNQFGGNFEQAEMVKAFIVSGEYRARFTR